MRNILLLLVMKYIFDEISVLLLRHISALLTKVQVHLRFYEFMITTVKATNWQLVTLLTRQTAKCSVSSVCHCLWSDTDATEI